jgi:chorismate mutase/prephenate dehydratase
LGKIKHVYSKDQALAQCRKWLESHLPNVELHDSASTSLAAVQASLDATAAAIASPLAGKLHNLKVVAPNIEDFDENYTRFLVIGRKFPAKSARDKTSVMLSIKDRVGALNDILMVFKSFGLNLTKIESRPSKKKAWEYIFFVDFLGHADDANIQKALKEVLKSCVFLKVLGSYPKGE